MRPSASSWPVDWWRADPPRDPARLRAARLPSAASDAALPFWSLVGFTVVMLLAPQESYPWLAPFRLAFVAAVCAALAHATSVWSRHEALLAVGPETRVCLLLVGWAILTVPFGVWSGGSIEVLTDLYFKSVVVFFLLAGIVGSTRRLHQLAWTLSLIATALALTGISHFASGTFSATGAIESRIVGYEGGLVRNPNDLALVLNLILPLTVMLLFAAEGIRQRLVLGAIVAAEVFGVFATFSRAGFVTLLAIGGLLLWRLRQRPGAGWLWAGLAATIIVLPLLPGAYIARLGTITDRDADPTGSAQSRWADQAVAIEYVRDHPLLGAGVGNDILVLNERRGARWTQVHNTYLQYAVDLGLAGLGLFVALLWLCLRAVDAVRRRCLEHHEAPVLLALADGVWISLMAFAVAALFHPAAYHVYFYYLAGLAMAVKATGRAELGS